MSMNSSKCKKMAVSPAILFRLQILTGAENPSGATLSDDGEFSPQVSREFSPETAKLLKKKATAVRKFENAN